MAGTAATALAAGSMAWYYHLYGSNVFAMTPAEEGFVHNAFHSPLQLAN
jgi:ubiquinol-cytochrome c reductase cytochrome c1 subunit